VYQGRWFDPDEDLEVAGYLTDEERAFAAALAAGTAPLVTPDQYRQDQHRLSDLLIPGAIAREFHPENELVAELSMSVGRLTVNQPGEPAGEIFRGVLDFGVHFGGNRVRGGALHNQCYDLCGESPGPPLDLTGDIDFLARQAAQWFGAVLRRPVVAYAWLHHGYAYALRHVFADTQETISRSFSGARAPRRLRWAAAAMEGAGISSSLLEIHGLPAPDCYVHVWGDMRAAVIPSGVRRTEQRNSYSGPWTP
jgi:hypothetical protein